MPLLVLVIFELCYLVSEDVAICLGQRQGGSHFHELPGMGVAEAF